MVMLSGILHHNIITGLHPVLVSMQLNMAIIQGLFNGQFPFVMRFLGEVLLVFIIGGIIGTLLQLDKVNKSDSHAHSRFTQ